MNSRGGERRQERAEQQSKLKEERRLLLVPFLPRVLFSPEIWDVRDRNKPTHGPWLRVALPLRGTWNRFKDSSFRQTALSA